MSQPKKKLSLEERLSLATKKGKKKLKKPSSTSTASLATLTTDDDDNDIQGNIRSSVSSTPVPNSPSIVPNAGHEVTVPDSDILSTSSLSQKHDTDENDKTFFEEKSLNADASQQQKELVISEGMRSWLPDNYENLPILEVLSSYVQPKIGSIQKENENLKSQLKDSQTTTKTDSSLFKLIRDKEDIIEQLKKEGETLSKNEFKKSNQVKSLKKTILNMEEEISDLHNQLNDKSDELDSLNESYSNIQTVLTESNEKISRLLKDNEELVSLQSELNVKNEKLNELTEELSTTSTTLNDEKLKLQDELDSIKEINNKHIMNLESTIEELKIELENNKDTTRDQSSSYLINNSNNDNSSTSLHNVRNQYELIQQQFNSSKQNWESIEFSLNTKITDLNTLLKGSKDDIDKLEKKIDELKLENSQLNSQLDKDHEKISNLTEEKKSLSSELESLNKSLHDLREDHALLEKKYNIQKSQLQQNIVPSSISSRGNSIDNFPATLDSTAQDKINSKTKSDIVLPKRKNISLSSTTSNDAIISTFQKQWLNSGNIPYTNNAEENIDNQIGDVIQNSNILGDGNSTLANENNDHYYHSDTMNDISINVTDDDDIPDEAAALQSLFQRNPSIPFTPSLRKPSTAMQSTNTNAQIMNAQMLSRLGSEIRCMEGEYRSLKESYDRLQAEKNNANEEILKLLKSNEDCTRLNEENTKLKSEIDQLHHKLETSLQLLGEKTETVDELKNDVDDLKEMLHQQVQQMVEMQERMG
ncbi:Sgm1p NDAI_0J02920 [Naumovozyma dairenensis CBS 421]|uniref:TATA element modulatory factor 1 TATA binding domain-containing protein n=1 Tax=Naumovozyma dairenensis (strain ATCC 10597 / BCRC 20456 / CBS 421 / NBRC 0211 / NRRL Y-12639) TaxID=1071378 RepID=G0WHA6_NAUDC|nr:hypothetical protein NDAI_0J02920 [Naumovozyma dairenensis CBS 421]CCD27184.1 hypothetical protein NDAI_0J02920 [Naumovozyma dairenensis CBS 421]